VRSLRARLKRPNLVPILVGAGIPWFCCLSTLLVSVWLNDEALNRYADEVLAYPLPARTEEVGRRAEVGLAPGASGSHCDFVVTRFLVTYLSCDEIRAYYLDARFPAADGNEDFPPLLDTRCGEGAEINGRLPVTVTVTDYGHTAYDPRCW